MTEADSQPDEIDKDEIKRVLDEMREIDSFLANEGVPDGSLSPLFEDRREKLRAQLAELMGREVKDMGDVAVLETLKPLTRKPQFRAAVEIFFRNAPRAFSWTLRNAILIFIFVKLIGFPSFEGMKPADSPDMPDLSEMDSEALEDYILGLTEAQLRAALEYVEDRREDVPEDNDAE